MGLDSFWQMRSKTEEHPHFDPPLQLCGGMFSQHGSPSFRGKVYSELIEDVVGISLYQEEIGPDDIETIATALAQTEYNPAWDEEYGVTPANYTDLRRMFSAYAEKDVDLLGWW